jgi:hypothetical protein
MTKRLLRCFVVLAFAASAASALTAAPKIEFENENLNFGKVAAGKPIMATFTFRNIGDAELDILEVKPGCGCTSAKAVETKLAPGASSTIEAVFNSTGYSGPIHKSITVTTNDPDRKLLYISIAADITSLATFRPERLNFGSIKVNTTRTHTMQVIPIDPKTFEITKVEAIGSHVSVPSFRKISDKNGDFWELTVVIKAGDKPGRVMGESINVVTNAGEKVVLNAMVYGNVIE